MSIIRSKLIFLFLSLIIIGLVILSINSIHTNKKLEFEISNLNSEIRSLDQNLSLANREISKNKKILESKDKEINSLNEEKEKINLKIKSVQDEIDSFKSEIDTANSWFKSNSNIANYGVYKSIMAYLPICLTTDTESNCKLRVGCINLVHKEVKEFGYKVDSMTTGVIDKLQSLLEFHANGGGDCEDYSLVVNAEINYLRGYCRERNRGDLTFEAIREGNGNYYLNKQETWYYPGAAPFFIPNDYRFSYVVCGNFPAELDPNSRLSEGVTGHCVIAFTDKEIVSSEDVHNSLVNAILVEPQTGFISYDLRDDDTMHIPINRKPLQYWDYLIYVVITYDDYYLFDNHVLHWRGYKDFLKEAEELKTESASLEQSS